MRERVQERLDFLGIKPAEAERRGNLRTGYIREFLIGKKSSMRDGGLDRAAAALECDPEYLLGHQDTPRKDDAPVGDRAAASIRIVGTIESGAWREPGAAEVAGEMPLVAIAPSLQFLPKSLAAYWVRGDHAAGLGIPNGSAVTVLLKAEGSGYHEGDVVVAQRTNAIGDIELSIRLIAAGELQARPAVPNSIPPVSIDEAQIIGLVVSATKMFGPALS